MCKNCKITVKSAALKVIYFIYVVFVFALVGNVDYLLAENVWVHYKANRGMHNSKFALLL